MMLDDFKNTKQLGYMRAWSDAVLSRIGPDGGTKQAMLAHCQGLVASRQLRCNSTVDTEVQATLKRLCDRSRITYSRATKVWSKSNG